MKKYLLAVDVGNTATSLGLFPLRSKGKPRVEKIWTVGTSEIADNKFSHLLRKKFQAPLNAGAVLDAIVSSVVHSIDQPLRKSLTEVVGASPHFVSAVTASKVRILYKSPKEVGADRIVNARAAMALTKRNAIVVDFGTATTFDCVTKNGEYLGGVIAPGPVISAEALFQRTAKLPLVTLDRPAKVLGRNTLESIQSGLYHGYRGLVKEIVQQLKKQMGQDTIVFATGGQAHWILKGVDVIDRHVQHLTLDGLFFLWSDLSGRSS